MFHTLNHAAVSIFALLLSSAQILPSAQVLPSAQAADAVSFRRDIAPILQENCVACHGAKEAAGSYRLDTFAQLSKAGESAVAPLEKADGQPIELLRRLTTADESERMPADSEPLTTAQIRLISDWVASGARFDGENPTDLLPFVIPPPRHPLPPDTYPAAVPVTALVFSPDGNHLLTGGYHEIIVWNPTDGKLQRRIQNIGQRTYAMAFADNDTTLAVACGQPGRGGEVRLVDFNSGEVKAVIARSTDVVLDLAFRPGGTELAVASADKSIHIINSETLEVLRTLSSHADWVTAVAWSQDGSRLVSASRDKSAKVYDATTGQLLVSYQGHGAAVRGVSVLPDGTQVISSGTDNKLHRWSIDKAKKVAEVGLGGEGYKLISAAGCVFVPTADRRLLKIDVTKNAVTQAFQGHADWVLSAALTSDQTHIAAGGYDGEVRVWKATDASLIGSWTAKP
jgi:mono/diheme cytochrome c family protein